MSDDHQELQDARKLLRTVLHEFAQFADAVDEWQAAMCCEPLDAKRTDTPDLIAEILHARKTIEVAGGDR